MAIATETKWIYDFGEGSREMRELLGGKGAGIAEMTRVLGPDLVPAGFTITTEACVAYMRNGRRAPDGLAEAVDEVGGGRHERRADAVGSQGLAARSGPPGRRRRHRR
jgi:pyruvate, orthophosphate dikinase